MDSAFASPGPGFWALDRSHYPGGTTLISQWLISESMAAGMEQVLGEIGAPIRRIQPAFVNGFMYTRVWPLIGADKPPKRLPPAPLLKLISHVHPEFRRRARQATSTLAERPALDVVRRWDGEIKPRLTGTNEAFQAVAPHEIDDAALQQHITALLDRLRENYELHFWLHGHDIGPIAQYLYECVGWGLDPDEAIGALSGASPSTARPLETLHRLRQLIGTERPATLDDVRAVSAEAAELLDGYLAERGEVLATGYDVTSFRLVELPGVVLASIMAAQPPDSTDHSSIAARLRERVPMADRATFDEVLADARAVMDMRDDNGPLTVEWPLGLLRRALLAAGARLTAHGAVSDPDLVFELTHEEARGLFGDALPSEAELARRADERSRQAALDPPPSLGDTEPEPPLDVLPQPLPKLVGMVQLSMRHLGMDGTATADGMTGVGVGVEAYTGRARTASSADDAIEKLEPGDVLVVRATSPAFNAVLMVAGAVVTANGGAMSHAAVLARELGIPAVVGAGGALTITDGSIVEVDPAAGLVRVVEPA